MFECFLTFLQKYIDVERIKSEVLHKSNSHVEEPLESRKYIMNVFNCKRESYTY